MDDRLPRPRKRFGQNFLHDRSVLDRIVRALDPPPGASVLEIGPGRGALTSRLIEASGRVVAVELDRDLAAHLRREFEDHRLCVVEGDVLEFDFAAGGPWCVAGNLPYNVSKPIAMRLVDAVDWINVAVLMFQREVAARLTAAPGSADYGPLSILPRAVYDIERLFDVPPGAFRPRPAVVSSVTRWIPRPSRPPCADLARLRATLRAGFAARRKTLANNVRATLGSAEILDRTGIDGRRRPQELDPDEWFSLSRSWPGASG